MGILKRIMNQIVQDVDDMKVDFQDALVEKGVDNPGNSLPRYPEKILEIPTGGGGGDLPLDMNRVRYWDIDGTLLKEEVVEDGHPTTAPEDRPDIPEMGLTFIGWSAREQDMSAVWCDLDIMPVYTSDGTVLAATFVDVPAGGTFETPLTGRSGEQAQVKWTADAESWVNIPISASLSHVYPDGYRGWVLFRCVNQGSMLEAVAGSKASYVKAIAGGAGVSDSSDRSGTTWQIETIYMWSDNSNMPGVSNLARKKIFCPSSSTLRGLSGQGDVDFIIAPNYNQSTRFSNSWRIKRLYAPLLPGIPLPSTAAGTYPTGMIGSLFAPSAIPPSAGSQYSLITRKAFISGSQTDPQALCLDAIVQRWTAGSAYAQLGRTYCQKHTIQIEGINEGGTAIYTAPAFLSFCEDAKIVAPAGARIAFSRTSVTIQTLTVSETFWSDFFGILADGGSATLVLQKRPFRALSPEILAIATGKGYSVASV